MAKDKSKKKDKGSADAGEFARPSESKGGGDGWKLQSDENVGKLFLFTPLSEKTVKGFEDKDTDVIVADVVEIDESDPSKSEEHEDAFVFARWIQGALREHIGRRKVLGRLAKDKSKGKGSNAAWVIEDASSDDVKLAQAYVAHIAANAFRDVETKSEKKSKG